MRGASLNQTTSFFIIVMSSSVSLLFVFILGLHTLVFYFVIPWINFGFPLLCPALYL